VVGLPLAAILVISVGVGITAVYWVQAQQPWRDAGPPFPGRGHAFNGLPEDVPQDREIEHLPAVRLVEDRTIPAYADVVIASDSTALLGCRGCTLERIPLTGARERKTYVLPKDPARMVLDEKRGLLYAVCTDPNPDLKPNLDFHTRQQRDTNAGKGHLRGLYTNADLYVFEIGRVLNGSLPEGRVLPIKHTIPLGAMVSSLLLSPDGAWVYFMDVRNQRIGRVSTITFELEGVINRLEWSTHVMCLTPNGKTLYAASYVGAFDHYNPGPYQGTVQKIDAAKLAIEMSVAVDAHTQDIRATDDGLVFLSAGSGQHVGCVLVDMKTGQQRKNWCVSPGSDMLSMSADQKLLFVSHGWHGTPHIHAVAIPPGLTQRARDVEINPGGSEGGTRREIRISPDGRFLLCDTGVVIRVEKAGPNPQR
jgi:hypothetical protein